VVVFKYPRRPPQLLLFVVTVSDVCIVGTVLVVIIIKVDEQHQLKEFGQTGHDGGHCEAKFDGGCQNDVRLIDSAENYVHTKKLMFFSLEYSK